MKIYKNILMNLLEKKKFFGEIKYYKKVKKMELSLLTVGGLFLSLFLSLLINFGVINIYKYHFFIVDFCILLKKKILVININNSKIISQKCFFSSSKEELERLLYQIQSLPENHIFFYADFLKDYFIYRYTTTDDDNNKILNEKYLKVFIRFKTFFLVKTIKDEVCIVKNDIYENIKDLDGYSEFAKEAILDEKFSDYCRFGQLDLALKKKFDKEWNTKERIALVGSDILNINIYFNKIFVNKVFDCYQILNIRINDHKIKIVILSDLIIIFFDELRVFFLKKKNNDLSEKSKIIKQDAFFIELCKLFFDELENLNKYVIL